MIDWLENGTLRLVERYGAFAESLRAELGRVFNSADPSMLVTRAIFVQTANTIAARYLADSRVLLDAAVAEALERASERTSSETDPELAASVKDAAERVLEALSAQVSRDIRTGETALAQFSLRATMAMRAHGFARGPAVAHLRSQMGSSIDLTFMDRSGRRWRSERYVRTLMRGFLLQAHNEAVLFVLSSLGHEEAELSAPGHRYDGLKFRIFPDRGDPDAPLYEEIIADVLHPNSSALIVESRSAVTEVV